MCGQSNIDSLSNKIEWLTWEECFEKNAKIPKKIFVDVMTSWCGVCKKMDKTTMQDSAIVNYISTHFYAVKFDAETEDTIRFNGNDFEFISDGKRGVNKLAIALLNSQLGFPSFVFLDEEYSRVLLYQGYKNAKQLHKALRFTNEEKYMSSSWEAFLISNE